MKKVIIFFLWSKEIFPNVKLGRGRGDCYWFTMLMREFNNSACWFLRNGILMKIEFNSKIWKNCKSQLNLSLSVLKNHEIRWQKSLNFDYKKSQ